MSVEDNRGPPLPNRGFIGRRTSSLWLRAGFRGRRRGKRGQSRRPPRFVKTASALHLEACQQFDVTELHARGLGAIAPVGPRESTPLAFELILGGALVPDATPRCVRPILRKGIDRRAATNLRDVGLRDRCRERGQQKYREHSFYLSRSTRTRVPRMARKLLIEDDLIFKAARTTVGGRRYVRAACFSIHSNAGPGEFDDLHPLHCHGAIVNSGIAHLQRNSRGSPTSSCGAVETEQDRSPTTERLASCAVPRNRRFSRSIKISLLL
jgi:hypothetical protein